MSAGAALLLAALVAAPAAPARADDVRTVRVLTYNIYGRRKKDCEERYKALARQVLAAEPPYDVVALNEHWRVPADPWFTCDADVLTRALEADGRYAGPERSVRHRPRAEEFPEVSGGDSVFTLHRISESREGKFTNGRTIPLSGFVLARVALAPGVELDVWGVHLEAESDGCGRDCRKEQLKRLASSVELLSGLPQKGRGGNPVLVLGDFNIGGPASILDQPPYPGNPGYDDILETLRKPRDLWLEVGSKAGPGYTYDCAENKTQDCKGRERIDYALLPEAPALFNPSSEWVLSLRSVSVVRWKTDSGQDVSDHYGLDATLELRRRSGGAVSVLGEAVQRLEQRLRELEGRLGGYPQRWR